MSGTYPNPLIYTDADFRSAFPKFADVSTYPADMLQNQFTIGTDYISATNWGSLRDASRQQALYLMTAHLQYMSDAVMSSENPDGSAPGIVTMGQIDKIKVMIAAPPGKSNFSYWLNQSPYGQQLLALLSLVSVGGFYFGGRPELAAFRRVGGFFGR